MKRLAFHYVALITIKGYGVNPAWEEPVETYYLKAKMIDPYYSGIDVPKNPIDISFSTKKGQKIKKIILREYPPSFLEEFWGTSF